MHGSSNEGGVATLCERLDQSALHRQAQRPDSWQPVVAGGTQHGARMANPPQPSASQRQFASDRQANVEGVRSFGDRHCRNEGESCPQKRLASLGHSACDGREPLHPQAQADVVILARPTGPVSTENVLRLLEHQQYRCALSGRVLTPQTASIDHIVPVRLGGEHTIENAQVLHKDVNRAKGSLTSEEYIGMCREIVRWSETSSAHMEVQP